MCTDRITAVRLVSLLEATRALHVYCTCMKKLTITVDDEIYDGLYKRIGPRKISRFLQDLARPHVVDEYLEAAYATMATDEVREAEATEWVRNLAGDVGEEEG